MAITGEGKIAKFDSVNGKSITYGYVIEETDNGTLQLGTNNNYIGTVFNKSGYKTDLTTLQGLETDKKIEADNMAPQVEKIEVISQEGEYKTEDEIQIKVTFNETVYTEKSKIPLIKQTAPNLNISFGEGEIRNPVVAEINDTEKYIIYIYKITAEDRGTLKLDTERAFDGTKTICDQVGNEVTLITGKDLEGSTITANHDLTQIFLDKKEITLDLNGTKSTELIADKDKAVDLMWESSNPSVVTIGEEIHKTDLEPLSREVATLTAVGIGESTISVKAPDGTIATCKVTVKDTTNGVTKIELNKTKLEFNLKENKTENLIATVTPNELAIEWNSTNNEVVTVDATGKVTAVAAGEAQIIAKAQDGTTAICEVKVTDDVIDGIEPDKIELNVKNIKVALGRTSTVQLQTKITPTDSNKNTKIDYESSNEEIATVDEKGTVTIKAKGNVVIIATSGNNKKAYCTIEIVEDVELVDKEIGDINEDQKVDTTDLLSILRHIAVTSSEKIFEKHQDWMLEGNKYIVADVNGNGGVDVTDSLKLQRHIAATRSETIRENHPDWIFGEI